MRPGGSGSAPRRVPSRDALLRRAPRRAVPFEEDDRDPSIWFLDHSYHEQMYRMCRRINGARAVAPARTDTRAA